MKNKYNDIETLIIDIERAQTISADSTLDRDVREDALVQFVARSATPLIELLDELKSLRAAADGSPLGGGANKTHRVIVEGFSDESAESAFSAALDKASHYFSEDHDISITVQQLLELPNGGHRATLEVHITPLSLRNTAHIKGADIELKRDHNKAFRDERIKENETLQHLIYDHFSSISNANTIGHLPPSLLINVDDAKLMHYMLEKQFLKAEASWHNAEKSHHKILVRFNKDIV